MVMAVVTAKVMVVLEILARAFHKVVIPETAHTTVNRTILNNANNPAKDVSSNYNSEAVTSSQGASSSGDTSNAASQSQSVAKRIVFEEDEFFRVTGMSFILLLIILTIAYYYRDDIKEMNSKR